MNATEVALVGAGPIGLELAVCFKLLGVNYIHLEAGQVGQTISWFPKQLQFFSSPERIAISGIPLNTPDQSKATREEYLAYLRGIVQAFDLQVNTFERVIDITPKNSGKHGFILTTRNRNKQHTYSTRNIVLAIGDTHRPRRLGIPGAKLEHVSHYFNEPHQYFHQELLIVGGRNSAVEAALRCHRAGAHVTLSYRQESFDAKSVKYWLLPDIQSLIKHNEIKYYANTIPTIITPTHTTLQSTDNQRSIDVPTDFVLLLIGYEMDPTLFNLAGVDMAGENNAPVFNRNTMQTNVPGLYVAGTASAGSQVRFKLFIENCHPHVTRIVRAITGVDAPAGRVNPITEQFLLPES